PSPTRGEGFSGSLPPCGHWYLHNVRTRFLAPSPQRGEGWGEGEGANAGTPDPSPPAPLPVGARGVGLPHPRRPVETRPPRGYTRSATLLERCVDTNAHKGGGLFWLPPSLWRRAGVGGLAMAGDLPGRNATPLAAPLPP